MLIDRVVEVEAERYRIRVGTLDIDVSAACFGTVRLDGQDVKVRKATIVLEADHRADVTLQICPA